MQWIIAIPRKQRLGTAATEVFAWLFRSAVEYATGGETVIEPLGITTHVTRAKLGEAVRPAIWAEWRSGFGPCGWQWI